MPDGAITELTFLVRLFVAGLLAGILGWERQHVKKAAGFRTHIIVGTAAASIWATAAIGMAAALGYYLLAVGATLLLLFVLRVLERFEAEHEG